jgi:hypothetical protein
LRPLRDVPHLNGHLVFFSESNSCCHLAA